MELSEGPSDTRNRWIVWLRKLAEPPLAALATRQLKAKMPVESNGTDREEFSHLEAIGRLLSGIAPWLDGSGGSPSEQTLRGELSTLSRSALEAAVHPDSPDRCNFTHGSQPIVDAAFLSLGLLRAPRALVTGLREEVRDLLGDALESTRVILPHYSNWLLFAAAVEAGLHLLGRRIDPVRVDYALRKHAEWYLGDGHYGDGPQFHWDYYNSYVIHPVLLAVLDELGGEWSSLPGFAELEMRRAVRYAEIQERMIAPDGSFPPVGRSIAYRSGAFHLLADVALRRRLPPTVSPGQARDALTAVLRRTLDAPSTFDPEGWLRIGLAGSQPGVGEGYISTGSLYLAATALLPLGLPPDDPFWAKPATPWTQLRIWGGEDAPPDHAL